MLVKRTFMQKAIHAPSKRELLFGIFCWFMFDFGFAIILELFFDDKSANGVYWMQVCAMLGSFLLVVVVFWRFLYGARLYADGMDLLKTVVFGFIAYWILAFIVEWIIMDVILIRWYIFEDRFFFANPNQQAIDTLVHYNPTVMNLCVILLAPVTEECLVRGMIFAPVCRKKPWLAYMVTTVLFAGLHVLPYIGEIDIVNVLLLMLAYSPAGVVLGWAYQNTRCIYGPIALHCAINLYATVV